MAAVITATADPTNSPPRMILNVSGVTGSSITVTRLDQSQNSSEVRGANPVSVVSGAWLGFDYEMPYNTNVTYQVTDSAGSSVTSVVSVPCSECWLIHPGIPGLSMPITIAGAPTFSRSTSRSLFEVLGREEYIARSSGQRKAKTFELSVRTMTAAEEDSLDTLLGDDSVLLLQIAADGVYSSQSYWVSIGDVSQAPLTVHMDGRWLWTLPCSVAARPAGMLQAQRTWRTVKAQGLTWRQVKATYATWRDFLIDNPIASTGGGGTGGGSSDTVAVTTNSDGTLNLTGSGVSDPGTGVVTLTLSSPGDVDNGNGTLTLV